MKWGHFSPANMLRRSQKNCCEGGHVDVRQGGVTELELQTPWAATVPVFF
jgi:hypothetical protein